VEEAHKEPLLFPFSLAANGGGPRLARRASSLQCSSLSTNLTRSARQTVPPLCWKGAEQPPPYHTGPTWRRNRSRTPPADGVIGCASAGQSTTTPATLSLAHDTKNVLVRPADWPTWLATCNWTLPSVATGAVQQELIFELLSSIGCRNAAARSRRGESPVIVVFGRQNDRRQTTACVSVQTTPLDSTLSLSASKRRSRFVLELVTVLCPARSRGTQSPATAFNCIDC
jgi:hypothetical protein